MRLDRYLVSKGFFRSRERAQEAIYAGLVKVAGLVKLKPSFELTGEKVELQGGDFDFVGRGALKLQGALADFHLKVDGLVCLDIGVATGGFTDLLLKNAAEKIYAVDIGEGQLAKELLDNPKVIFKNQTDARELQKTDFAEDLDLVVIDVSFISILQLLPALERISNPKTNIVALIKPQFELGKPHKGVITDAEVIERILKKVRLGFRENNFDIVKETSSKIKGKEGNQEYLWLIRKNS